MAYHTIGYHWYAQEYVSTIRSSIEGHFGFLWYKYVLTLTKESRAASQAYFPASRNELKESTKWMPSILSPYESHFVNICSQKVNGARWTWLHGLISIFMTEWVTGWVVSNFPCDYEQLLKCWKVVVKKPLWGEERSCRKCSVISSRNNSSQVMMTRKWLEPYS